MPSRLEQLHGAIDGGERDPVIDRGRAPVQLHHVRMIMRPHRECCAMIRRWPVMRRPFSRQARSMASRPLRSGRLVFRIAKSDRSCRPAPCGCLYGTADPGGYGRLKVEPHGQRRGARTRRACDNSLRAGRFPEIRGGGRAPAPEHCPPRPRDARGRSPTPRQAVEMAGEQRPRIASPRASVARATVRISASSSTMRDRTKPMGSRCLAEEQAVGHDIAFRQQPLEFQRAPGPGEGDRHGWPPAVRRARCRAARCDERGGRTRPRQAHETRSSPGDSGPVLRLGVRLAQVERLGQGLWPGRRWRRARATQAISGAGGRLDDDAASTPCARASAASSAAAEPASIRGRSRAGGWRPDSS